MEIYNKSHHLKICQEKMDNSVENKNVVSHKNMVAK